MAISENENLARDITPRVIDSASIPVYMIHPDLAFLGLKKSVTKISPRVMGPWPLF